MFYESEQSKALRLGDILPGFIFIEADIEDPRNLQSYKIDVITHRYCVVMTPCCSIRDRILSITPLLPIRPSYLENPYFKEDLTRINRVMKPEQTVASEIWDGFPPEEKLRKLQAGETYALPSIFIYEKHDSLANYSLHSRVKRGPISTNYYSIDFKNVHKIRCEKVITPENSPYDMKILELSKQARSELRNKLADFFKRTPAEDIEAED